MSANEIFSLTTYTNTFGEKYIYELAQQLFHKVDSQTIFSSKFGNNLFQADSFYIICGTDSGLLINFILKTEIPKSAKIVFVELPEIITWVDQNCNLPPLPDNICIIDFSRLIHQLNDYDINSYVLLDKLFFIPSLSTQYGYYPSYTELSDNILKYIKTLHWNIRIGLDRKDFIVGQLENLAENQIHSSILDNTFKGHTAILLAGGPSLIDILPWVKDNRESFVVFAVSRIAKQLLDFDLSPDFFVTVHTQPISFDVSKEMLLFHRDSVLISHSQACPQLISQWQGKHVFMDYLLPWESKLNALNQELAGPTVSHAAFDRIVRMGFSTIILGGVDLCFSLKDKSHAKGSIEFEKTSQAEGGDVQVLTNDGKVAETTFAFHRGIIEFGRMAIAAKKHGCKTFNPSLKSAKIDGVTVVDLQNVPLSRPRQLILEITDTIELQKETPKHYKTVLRELQLALTTSQELRKRALNGFQEVTKILDLSIEVLSPKALQKIQKIETAIEEKQFTWIFNVIYSFGIHFFTALTSPIKNKNTIDRTELDRKKLYFTAIIVSIDRLSGVFKSCIERVTTRIEEEKPDADIQLITQQWRKDKQPGRALIFLQDNPSFLFSANDNWKNTFEELKEQFENQISAVDHTGSGLQENIIWNKIRLQKLRTRIFTAHSNKEVKTLEKIIDSLEESTSPETSLSQYLAKGLLSELNNDLQTAISYYNKIIEENDHEQATLLEDSLSRIASISISLKDFPNAQLALQCLADISLSHVPTYANFLYISGDTDLALEVYADYLGKVPDDLQTMLKLGQIYKDLKSQEGIKMVSDYVLERDPKNSTALSLRDYLIITYPSV